MGPEPVALDPCPFYTESIVAGGPALKSADQRFLLNCVGAGSAVAPGSSVTLQMRDVVPADAPIGPAQLSWTLDSGALAQNPSTATAAFTITGR